MIRVYRSPSGVAVILVRFQWSLNFLERLKKKSQMPHFMKIRPVGVEFFHGDGRRDMTNLMTAFRNFANAQECLYFRSPSTKVNL